MRIGIIGPSKLKNRDFVFRVAEVISKTNHEVVLTADNGSVSEFFANSYLDLGGEKVFSVVPLDDEEFGNSWVVQMGEVINCSTWRNQPEKLNEECDCLISLGYSSGGLIEICYSKWFKKKKVYILNEFIKEKLPEELEESLDLVYLDIEDLEKVLSD